jgi:hypothetical protein
VSVLQKLAAYRAQIEMSRKGASMDAERKSLQGIVQLLSSIFWKLKFIIDQNNLDDDFKKELVIKIKLFKQQKQPQDIYDVQSRLKSKCNEIPYQLGRELDIIKQGAKLLGISSPKFQWLEKVKSIEDEKTYEDMKELYNTIMKQKSELINSIDQVLKLKSARELLLRILKEGEVKLSEFDLKQLEELLESPLQKYLSIKLSGK